MELTLQVLSTGDKLKTGRGRKMEKEEKERSAWKQGEQNGGDR